ncbi:Cytosol [Ecytonucleospora hepatopenaei]|uniref:Cytosol n=1 Tax=Ecytonucleospora hepatopenaei TaxID=646526 RepID=A0A1W0E7D0_9MICR|nr:Cytosol [Ecytonucleospora hepatopenaei]
MEDNQVKLLNYGKLRSNLNAETCTFSLIIHFYCKINNCLQTLEKNTSNLMSFLFDKKATGKAGEIFELNNEILFSIGEFECELVNLETEDFWNIQNNMGELYKYISKYYSNSNVLFSIKLLDTDLFDPSVINHCYYGFILSSYKYTFLKKEESEIKINLIYEPNFSNLIETVELAHAQNIARFLGDTPANLLTPGIFVSYAKNIFRDIKNIEIKVLENEECIALGMNLFNSVGQGSVQDSKLLCIKYNGSSNNLHEHTVALVGKGVTFDSGGISLKPGLDMHRQKMDMMGGATMLMSFYAACKIGLPLNMSCTIPLVENMPSYMATKPGDVHVGMNGLSVEINNTDAEGRLILADGVYYAQTQYTFSGKVQKPKYLFNTCTLTGAMKIALGNIFGGYFTNSEELHEIIKNNLSGESLWRMPLSAYYKKQLKSDVADLKNIGGKLAGACTAAEFIHSFITEDVKWAHFDIAGIKDQSVTPGMYGNGATARPMLAFLNILKEISKN